MGLEAVACTRVMSRAPVLFDAPGEDGAAKVSEEEQCSTTTSSSSSIGRNSDDDASSERSMAEDNENEAESAYNGGPLHAMEALEEVLPIRYGYILPSSLICSLCCIFTTTFYLLCFSLS